MTALWQFFYPENPFAGYEPEVEEDLQGWNAESPVFPVVLEKVQPSVIIEVGTWKGASAVRMAELAPQASVLCIDTWLGSVEAWVPHQGGEFKDMFDSLRRRHGYPQLYYTFASNVVRRGLQERICPLPMPSTVAARLLQARQFTADLIYIDGSHEYQDVKRDLMDYWPLVKPGGVLLGDDYNWHGVRKAVDSFFPVVDAVAGVHWMVRKKKDAL